MSVERGITDLISYLTPQEPTVKIPRKMLVEKVLGQNVPTFKTVGKHISTSCKLPSFRYFIIKITD